MTQITGVTEVLFPKAVVNAFVVRADVPTLIDTGTPGGAAKVLSAIAKAGLNPADIERIVLTHRHADHAGNAAELARATGAEVHVAPADAPFVAEGREQPRPRPTTPLGRVMVPYVKLALPWALDKTPVQETLSDGASVGPFRVIGTPGATPPATCRCCGRSAGCCSPATRRRTSPASGRTPPTTTRRPRGRASVGCSTSSSRPPASATGAAWRPAPRPASPPPA